MNTALAGPSAAPADAGSLSSAPVALRNRTLDLLVTDIITPAPGIRGFNLAAPDGGPLPAFVPGSHLVVDAGGRRNAYSLTGDGTDPRSYSISVLKVPGGSGGSVWLHESVAVGSTVTVGLPRNAFAPVARARRHLLIAGGIGITPMISHLRAARRWGRDVQLLYVFGAGAAVHVDDAVALAGSRAEFFTGRESFGSRLAQVLPAQPVGTHLYLCGPPSMIDSVVAAATGAGWPDSRIHFERFGIDALDAGEPFRVELTESGSTLDVPSGTSLLEALESRGIEVPNLCRQGVCGECRIPLTGGTADHRDVYLRAEEKQVGDAIMPCVSRAAPGCTLEIPL